MVKMKKALCLFLLLTIFSFAFANGAKEEAQISDSYKEPRIVSLAPNATEIICALGSESNLVGRTSYCNYPETVSSIQNIGDMYDPNIELIISLRPDMVIATSIVSPDVVEQLNTAGIKTYQFFHEYEGIDGCFTLIEEIGNVINKSDKAAELIESLKTRRDAVLSKSADKGNTKSAVVIITWGEWGDYAATGDTFIEDMIKTAGAENIASDAKYWAISKELLLSRDPDFIFITNDSNYVEGDLAEAFKTTEPYSQLKASKNNNVYVLENDEVSRLSIRMFDVLEQMYELIH